MLPCRKQHPEHFRRITNNQMASTIFSPKTHVHCLWILCPFQQRQIFTTTTMAQIQKCTISILRHVRWTETEQNEQQELRSISASWDTNTSVDLQLKINHNNYMSVAKLHARKKFLQKLKHLSKYSHCCASRIELNKKKTEIPKQVSQNQEK